MVRGTARSNVIGYSYRECTSAPNKGCPSGHVLPTSPPFDLLRTQNLGSGRKIWFFLERRIWLKTHISVWSVATDTLEAMCGRYATSASPQDLMEEFEVDDLFDGVPGPDSHRAPTLDVAPLL